MTTISIPFTTLTTEQLDRIAKAKEAKWQATRRGVFRGEGAYAQQDYSNIMQNGFGRSII